MLRSDNKPFASRDGAHCTSPCTSALSLAGVSQEPSQQQAESAYKKAAELQPDARVYQNWAIALGSQQRSAEALEVIQMGLELEPRNPHLLRSQMLAYRALDVPEMWQKEAADAFDAYKRDTQAPHVRDRCSAEDEVCRAERTPITVRWLTD